MAILLLGGDKSGQWERWYRVNIPIADALYVDHILGHRNRRPGSRQGRRRSAWVSGSTAYVPGVVSFDGVTQSESARRRGVLQSHVAQVETRDDVNLSNLISYVRAPGGGPRIEAAFPGEEPVAVTLDAPSYERNSEAARASA
jgi:hypothetical protein